ncbi:MULTISPECIES: YraN family protein [Bifidobacterium]|nr:MULTISPECIES: YraN family protein [Bifidobacterium]
MNQTSPSLQESRNAGTAMPVQAPQHLIQLTMQLHRPGLTPRQLGRIGEDYAAIWLQNRGWTIIDRNWGSRYGELDIIAIDRVGQLAFVEVKTRRSAHFGAPQDAVDAHKRMALRRAGLQWLQEHGRDVPHMGMRFDVLALSVLAGRRAPQIRHIPGAF